MEPKETLMELADGKFDTITQRVSQEAKNMKAVSTFFQATRKELEQFGKGLQKAVVAFKTSYQPAPVMGSWEQALAKFMKLSEDFTKTAVNTAQTLSFKIVEPFDIFMGHYEQSNKAFLREGAKIVESLVLQRNKLKRLMDRIAKTMVENTVDENLWEEYKLQIAALNTFIDEHEDVYRAKIRFIMQNEENRIDFERKLFTKFMDVFEDLGNDFLRHTNDIKAGLRLVKPIADVEEKAEENTHEIVPLKLFEKVDCVEPNPPRKPSDGTESSAGAQLFSISSVESILSDVDSDLGVNIELPVEETKFLYNAFQKLMYGEDIGSADKQRLTEIAQYSDGRHKISELLSGVSQKACLPSPAFKTLGEVLNNLLTVISLYNDNNITHLIAVLSFVSLITTSDSEKGPSQYYLREMISDNGIWRSKERWQAIIQSRIDRALLAVAQTRPQQNAEPAKGLMQKIFSAGAKLIGKKPATGVDTAKEEAGKKSIVYSELSTAAVELALMNIDPDMGRDILIHFALIYNIDQDKLFQLLSDYESSQPLAREEDPGKKEEERLELAKREKERKKYGYSKATMIVGMSLKYIETDATLQNLLVVNKEWNNVFKSHVYKIILKACTNSKRHKIWQVMLTTRGFDKLYIQLKSESLEDFRKTYKSVDDVIKLDVNRSFHLYNEKEQEAIMNVLRCYAVFNPEIEYCQGMNFLAGFYYLIYRNEPVAFSMLCTLIANLELSYLFKHDVPMLRMFFYQMNRLIAIYLPRLHAHLFQEGINATYFCSPWFLTCFTFVLQSCKTKCIPLLLNDIFDGLLTSGFKAIFKAGLFILYHFEEKLLKMSYEELVQFLNELPKTGFFNSEDIAKEYRKMRKIFNITQGLLDRLNAEYKQICVMSGEYRNSSKKLSAVLFKHYINSDKGKLQAVYFPK